MITGELKNKIDNIRQTIWNSGVSNPMTVVEQNGEFPVLKPGANAISWTGTVTKVVVRPNWRYL